MTINLSEKVTRDGRHQLHWALDMGIGMKAFVISKSVSGIISHFTEPAFLKDHGCEKLGYLDSSPPIDASQCSTVMFISRPDSSEMHLIAGLVKNLIDAPDNSQSLLPESPVKIEKRFYLFCLPRTSLLCKKVLEDWGILANIEVHNLEIDLVPLESDLFSLEMPSLRNITVAQDHSAIYQLAHALLVLETGIGSFSSIRGRGPLAQLFVKMRTVLAKSFPSKTMFSSTNNLILIDRTIDLVTPLMTPQTYAGLLDMFRNIQCGFVEIDTPDTLGRLRKLKLDKTEDAVYKELADLHFDAAALTLKDLAVKIRTQNNELQNTESIAEINQFVDRLPEIVKSKELISIHLRLAEMIRTNMDEDYLQYLECEQGAVSVGEMNTDYIDELIWGHRDIHKTLALICITSLTCNIREKQLDTWRGEFIQTYGLKYMGLWKRLQTAGLIRGPTTRPRTGATWTSLRKAFNLVRENVELNSTTTDISYTFSGYAPLSACVVQELMGTGSILPAERVAPLNATAMQDPLSRILPVDVVEQGTPNRTGHLVVVYLGGISLAEVSAVRLLGKLAQRQMTVLTTEIVTPARIISSFC